MGSRGKTAHENRKKTVKESSWHSPNRGTILTETPQPLNACDHVMDGHHLGGKVLNNEGNSCFFHESSADTKKFNDQSAATGQGPGTRLPDCPGRKLIPRLAAAEMKRQRSMARITVVAVAAQLAGKGNRGAGEFMARRAPEIFWERARLCGRHRCAFGWAFCRNLTVRWRKPAVGWRARKIARRARGVVRSA